MRDINDVLKLFACKHNMDYCRDFDRVKSVLEYCNGHIKEFQKIHFRGGNVKAIDETISRLEEELKGNKSEQDLRKIAFLLVLNTDMTYKYDLRTDLQICHVLNLTPPIPKCLLLSLMWELKLEEFFYECLRYCPSWFTYQFVEPAAASMKYLEPYDALDKIDNLICAIVENICRMDFRVMDPVTKKILLNKFYDHSMELLRQFYTPDIERFSEWPKREFFKYSGFAIRHILKMVLFMFDCIEFPVRAKIEEKYRIYEICKNCSPLSDSLDDGYVEVVRDMLQKILMALLNTLQYNVMLVTIDVFMHWTEVDATDDLTLQSDIGDHAYRVIERIKANKQFGHDVHYHLGFVAIRQKTLEEKIHDATIGEILRKLDSNEVDNKEKLIWLEELIKRPVVFGNEECLETIKSNAKLISIENCIQIMDYMKSTQKEADDDMSVDDFDEILPEIVIKCLDNFNCDQLMELLVNEVKIFGKDLILFRQDGFDQRCTMFFNKSTDNFDQLQFLKLCFESPSFAWQKFFNEACVSHQQAKNFCTTAAKVKKFSKFYLEGLLTTSFPAKYEDKFYPHLLFEINESQLTDKETFFKGFIYKNVADMLDAQHYKALLVLLQALSMIVHKTKTLPVFGAVTVPVLVMIAQIMDQCRWDFVTYSDLNDEIVRMAIDCVQTASKTYLPFATERDREWISSKVEAFRPLTQYYFQKYSLAIDEQPKTFDEFLRTEPLTDRASIEKFLIANYVRCTMKETEWLARSDLLRPYFSDMIILLESLVADIGENAIKNFRHSILNYANLIKKFLLPDAEGGDSDKVTNLGFSILKILKNAPSSLYEEIFMNFHGILLDVFGKLQSVSEDQAKEIRNFVSGMPSCKGREIFEQKFEAMLSGK